MRPATSTADGRSDDRNAVPAEQNLDLTGGPDECVINIDYCRDNRVAMITLWGTVRRHALENLCQVVDEAIDVGPRWAMLDLSAARLDADGLALLTLTARKLSRRRIDLIVTGVDESLQNAFTPAGLTPHCSSFASFETALSAIDAALSRRHKAV